MRPYSFVPVVVAALTVASALQAAEPSVGECLSATETSLTLRSEHKLREARAQLLVCSADSCPAEMREECVHRMGELNSSLPSVVFTVKTGAGQELAAVKVTMDGELVADHLDGSALTLDPGSHQFTFETEGQPPATETLILHEGEKDRREMVLVGPPAPPAPLTTPAPVPLTPQAAGTTVTGGGSGFRTLGLVVGGVGVAGLAVGGVFGIMASSAWNNAQKECPTHTGCSEQAMNDHNTTTTFGTVSTVAFVSGAVLAAAGITLYLVSPRGTSPTVGLMFTRGASALIGSF